MTRELEIGTYSDYLYNYKTRTEEIYNHALLRLPLNQNYDKDE